MYSSYRLSLELFPNGYISSLYMGSATGKCGGGDKGSWTERQIGMLLSYFVLIKLRVIKCLFNYDNAIIIIYKMQVKFINQRKFFFC